MEMPSTHSKSYLACRMQLLNTLTLVNWKSIADQRIELRPLNVMVGANGAGKSNVLSVMRMLIATFGKQPGFQRFVAEGGGADSLLHLGLRHSRHVAIELEFATDKGSSTYAAEWSAAALDSLIFTDERISFARENGPASLPRSNSLGAGHRESALVSAAIEDTTAKVILHLLRGCRVYHFHDTSTTSPMRGSSYVEANRFLYPDGGNLAAMLYLIAQDRPAAFQRIEGWCQQAISGFGAFVLEPSKLHQQQIFLKWQQVGSQYELGPHQLSDGSLRFIALATLLGGDLASSGLLVCLDEPELGLHPAALTLLAELIRVASTKTQLLVATQSPGLLSYFDPEDVIVAESINGASQFSRLNAATLEDWLEDYSLGEVWERNIIGGGPY